MFWHGISVNAIALAVRSTVHRAYTTDAGSLTGPPSLDEDTHHCFIV